MAEVCYGDPKYIVLHFKHPAILWSTKVCATWRGAQMSKRNHERLWGPERGYSKILPMSAIIQMKGLEAPETSLTVGDREILKRMGILA